MKISDNFWSPIQDLMIDFVLPYQLRIMEDEVPGAEKSHAIQNFRIAAGEAQGQFYGMVFQDSDVAKWLEAVAYALAIRPNSELEARADEIIALIGRAQEDDGYVNTFFTVKEPEHKWQNLLECHELYCAGHFIEAAVAYHAATGKTELLHIMRRFADLICARFGKGKMRGIPGHQEIELALYRLYKTTGDAKYLETAQYFLDERGTEPSYFEEELARRDWYHWGPGENREYAQNHAPVRQQTEAVGHSVRAVYMYAAMANVAAETADASLAAACRTLWNNIVHKRMYITGGIGSTHHLEAFTTDYDLPNDTIYAETCASIAMVFFARAMLELEPRGEYADGMELQLFNGILSGMQLDGTRFFYVNPLEVVPETSGVLPTHRHALPRRPEWFGCACCPPNMARLITSLGRYAWGEGAQTIRNHLFIGGTAELLGGNVKIETTTDYPWGGTLTHTIIAAGAQPFTFAQRVPEWCDDWTIKINGEEISPAVENGYAQLSRVWHKGDTLELCMQMPPRRVYASTKVRENANCVAIMRGPLVYCVEECDNGADLSALRLPRNATLHEEKTDDLGGVIAITAQGTRLEGGDALYSTQPPRALPARIRAIPYYAWANRDVGGMRVWLHEG
ncbi:MAG: glycoside hydrolase family 127 protein [Defluviitaleaceae bacterium]|nr:glycoside hydrolase family 127 protein [Defluviitaleaceae bacterium]MCL2238920.1 glycoside hydrolase family 127 protein [Defluviitaleaceae bacterium]